MCSFIFTNKELNNKDINTLSSKRGPDHTEFKKIQNYNIFHNLLDISKKKAIQPIVENNIILLFNGEIYEPKSECDTYSIIPLYIKYGKKFIEKINGEYAIFIMDENENKFFLYSDVFATKPLFYSIEDEYFGVSSYSSELKKLKFKEIKRVEPSTFIEIDLNSFIVKKYEHSKFDLTEYKNNYDDCILALEHSFKLRCNDRVGVGLSSGHDSGAILQWFISNKLENGTFYTINNNRESHDVMLKRYAKCEENNIKYKYIDYFKHAKIFDELEFKYLSSNMELFDYYKSEFSLFEISKLLKDIKRDGINIFISGQGSDEIISNYYEHEVFFKNLKEQFPWENFYDGKNRLYIDELEYVGGSYGLEVRYPFLDKFFVQEFLNLSSNLKSSRYKSIISEYLDRHLMPVNKNKQGMGIKRNKYLFNKIRLNS